MEARSESSSSCYEHSKQSSVGICCHKMPCQRSIKVPHRTSIKPQTADLHCHVSRHMKYTMSHWLSLMTLYTILLFNVCNGLVVSKKFLGAGNYNTTDTELIRDRRGLATVEGVPSPAWENATVPYIFEKGLPLRMQRQAVQAMCAWMKQTQCIKFVARTNEPHFIKFVFSHNGECNSFVGRLTSIIYYPPHQEPCGQPLFLAFSCNRGNIMHELGHALGFYHEHQRPDRDVYVRVHFQNILPTARSRFEKRRDIASLGASYDYGSVMHYGLFSYSDNKEQTIEPLLSYDGVIGQRKRLSVIDRVQVNDVYSCPDIDANKDMLPTDADIILDGNWITLSPLGMTKSYNKRLVCDSYNCTLSTCAGRLYKYHDVADCPDNLISIKKIAGIRKDKIIREGDTVSIRWEIVNTVNRTASLVPLYCTNDSKCSLSQQCQEQEPCLQQMFTINAQGKELFQAIKHSDKISLSQLHPVSNNVSVYALSCTQSMSCTTTLQCIVPIDSVIDCNVWFRLQKY